jgi:hypothetical protein
VSIEATAKITLVGASEALKSLQGVTRETGAAGKAAKGAAEVQAAAAKKAAAAQQDVARSADKSKRDIERSAQRTADAEKRLAQETAKAHIAEMAKVTQAAEREAAKQRRTAEKTAAAEVKAKRETLRQIGGLMATAGAGLAAGIGTAVATSRTGSKSLQERIAAGNDFTERLVRVSSSAGLTSEESAGVQAKIIAASKSTGIDAGELLGSAETGQGQFGNLRWFADNIEEIGRISKASGADVKTLSASIGFANQAFELTGEQAKETGYALKAAADVGSVELSDLANAFAPVAGIYAMTTNQKGVKGRNQFLGMAETLNTAGFGAEGSAVRGTALLSAVSAKDTQDKLKAIGVKGFVGKDGSIDLSSLIKQLASNKKFQSADVRQKIFTEQRGQQGIEALVAARKRVKAGVAGAVDLDSFNLDTAAAKAKVDAGMDAMKDKGFFKNQVAAAEMQAHTIEHLEEMNTQLGFVSGAADTLEKSFGALSIWASSIAALGVTSVLSAAIQGKLFGGAAAAEGGLLGKAAGAVGGAFGTLGGAMGGTLAAASGATIAGGVALAGGVGVAAGMGFNAASSWLRDDKRSLSDMLADAMSRATGQNEALDRIGGTRVNAQGGTSEIVAVLKTIDAGIRANAAKPTAGAPREPA